MLVAKRSFFPNKMLTFLNEGLGSPTEPPPPNPPLAPCIPEMLDRAADVRQSKIKK
jgi:hypothetical protein